MNDLFTNNDSAVVSSDRILYTASSFARSSLFHLQEIGKLEAKKEHTSSRSDLRSFLFFIVLGGSGTLEYDGKCYKLENNSCVFIDCKKQYSHTTQQNDLWTLCWCHFYGPTMPSVYQKYCERGGRPVFTPDDASPFHTALGELLAVAKSSDYMRDMKINSLLSRLMLYVMSESWHPENIVLPNKRSHVLDVKKYLDENYASHITLDDLCSRFYISKFYLTHSFKDRFGVSITNYLLSVRITRAKHLLRFSNKTVEEIGYETGIGAPAYFSRVFKGVEGVSPKVYREQW